MGQAGGPDCHVDRSIIAGPARRNGSAAKRLPATSCAARLRKAAGRSTLETGMAGLPFSGLRARLVLLVLVAVLPALGLALHAGLQERQAAGDRVRDDTLLLTRLAAADHARMVELTQQFLATLAQLPEIRQADSPACSALLDRMLHQHPMYADLGVVNGQDQRLCGGLPAFEAAPDPRRRPLVRHVLETRAF